MKFPKKIHVVIQKTNNGEHFLIAEKDVTDLDSYNDEKVGIYELKEEKTVKVNVGIE